VGGGRGRSSRLGRTGALARLASFAFYRLLEPAGALSFQWLFAVSVTLVREITR
jgi:hypothetical protein